MANQLFEVLCNWPWQVLVIWKEPDYPWLGRMYYFVQKLLYLHPGLPECVPCASCVSEGSHSVKFMMATSTPSLSHQSPDFLAWIFCHFVLNSGVWKQSKCLLCPLLLATAPKSLLLLSMLLLLFAEHWAAVTILVFWYPAQIVMIQVTLSQYSDGSQSSMSSNFFLNYSFVSLYFSCCSLFTITSRCSRQKRKNNYQIQLEHPVYSLTFAIPTHLRLPLVLWYKLWVLKWSKFKPSIKILYRCSLNDVDDNDDVPNTIIKMDSFFFDSLH